MLVPAVRTRKFYAILLRADSMNEAIGFYPHNFCCALPRRALDRSLGRSIYRPPPILDRPRKPTRRNPRKSHHVDQLYRVLRLGRCDHRRNLRSPGGGGLNRFFLIFGVSLGRLGRPRDEVLCFAAAVLQGESRCFFFLDFSFDVSSTTDASIQRATTIVPPPPACGTTTHCWGSAGDGSTLLSSPMSSRPIRRPSPLTS
jgi:hypothetical protein